MQEKNMAAWQSSSYLSGSNAGYIEELYETYLKNPDAVDPHWRDYFQSLPQVNGSQATDVSHADIREQFLQLAKQPRRAAAVAVSTDALMERKQANLERLIDAYRTYGHLAAQLDP